MYYIYYSFISLFYYHSWNDLEFNGWRKNFGEVIHYKDGLIDREGGPAIINYNGDKHWYKEGKRHREGGPASEYTDGQKVWFKEGNIHREDGPALITSFEVSWYKEGKHHRLDGPAVAYSNGNKYWFIEGKQYTEEEWKRLSFAILNNLEVFL